MGLRRFALTLGFSDAPCITSTTANLSLSGRAWQAVTPREAFSTLPAAFAARAPCQV